MASIRPTLHTGAIAALEAAANRALSLDPVGTQRLDELAGNVFRLKCTSPELDIYLLPGAGKLKLMTYWDGEVTTAIRGSAADFADLAGSDDPTTALINGALELEGDSAPLIELQQVLPSPGPGQKSPFVVLSRGRCHPPVPARR